jgi:sterol desaturase/sphingolipid hydroxylase (fatty acid hydroxylase superfamily)
VIKCAKTAKLMSGFVATCALMIGVDDHSGYAVPYSPFRLNPWHLWDAGAAVDDGSYHYFHHQNFQSNYSEFTFDWFLGGSLQPWVEARLKKYGRTDLAVR